MRLLPRRRPPKICTAALLATALVTALFTAAAPSSAAVRPAGPADDLLPRPVADDPALRGALAPIAGTVTGLTGPAAQQAAGPAADRFRDLTLERARRYAASARSAPRAALAPAAQLHTDWGVFLPQARSTGLHATQSVLTGAGTTTRGGDYVYAPTAIPAGGACMEMTTAYTPSGPKLWAWDWCGGRDGVGKIVDLNASFLSTYTTTVNGLPAYSVDIHQTAAATNTWTTYLYNYQTHVWDVFFTSSGTYDLPQFTFGWDMFEIYTSVEPATGTGYYCTDLAGRAFESSSLQVSAGGVWTPASTANTSPIGTIPSGDRYDCPALKFTVKHANDNWIAQIGGGSQPPAGGNLARTATPSASYTSPWESVGAINDGREPASSNDTANPRWGTWPNQGQQTATLTWGQAQRVGAVEAYFFDDNGGVRLPASWCLQYLNASGAFADVPGGSGYPVAANRYNRVTFPALSTTQLRLVLQGAQAAVGLLEVRAYAQ